jgi:hypothetical protein
MKEASVTGDMCSIVNWQSKTPVTIAILLNKPNKNNI